MTALNKARMAVMESDVCGVMYMGVRHFCDHPYLPDDIRQSSCSCKEAADAAVNAFFDNSYFEEDAAMAIATLYGNYIPDHGWTGFGPRLESIVQAMKSCLPPTKLED